MSRIASVFLVHDKKLLLHLRDDGHPDPNLRNKWGLVGGSIEKGEEPLAAALREIKEETNLAPSKIDLLGKLEIKKPYGKIEAFLFYSQLSDEEVNSLKLGNEGKAIQFFGSQQILRLPLSPEVKKYYSLNQVGIDSLINNGEIPTFRVS